MPAALFYSGGKDKYKIERMLSPGQQLWLDVGHLIRDQIPDSDGHTIPLDTMSGSYELSDLDHATVGQLYEGKLVIDKTYGHASYGCANCCGYTLAYFDPSTFGGPPGMDYGDVIDSTEQCGGEIENVTGDAYDWNSSDTAVATLPNSTLHTIAVGGATGNATVTLQGTHPAPRCPQVTYGPAQPISVHCPTSTSVNALTALSITLLFPGLKTGIGAVASMQVSPTTTNWNGYEISESLATASNSCPASWGNMCQGSSTFTIGEGGQAEVSVNGVDTPVGPVFTGEENLFYDQHTFVSNVSLLDSSGINSCTAVCTQTYSCSGTPVSSHTITYSFIKAQITGTHVTSTEVSDQ
jgi:hypothetical protein